MTEEQIYKYVSGQANEKEQKDIQDWISHSKERQLELSRIKNIWIASGIDIETDPIEKERAILTILSKIRDLKKIERFHTPHFKYLKYAAAILLIIGLSGAMGYLMSNKQLKSNPGYTEIAVPFGDRSNITLPDGSVVRLNSGSSLRYASTFTRKRTVKLEGEAFFEVTHDKSSPFIVETSNLDIEVLGTKFNVSSYKDDSFISTYLQSGKIKVTLDNKDEVILKPTDLLEFDKTEKLYSKSTVDDMRYTDWTHGILTVDGETIEMLSKKLTRRYGIEIIFGDEEAKKHTYTGSIKDEDLNTVLEALRYSSSIGSKKEGHKVKLYSIK